jgi:DNA polymerase III alpha subunit
MMAAFAGYGFPKAHAASYAQIGWRSAWCKTHFPAEFMAAVLANWGGYYSQRVYLSEARRMGLIVRPPHVNFSKGNFVVREIAAGDWEDLPHTTAQAAVSGGEDAASSELSFGDLRAENPKALFMGLDQVRDLTRRTIERIMRLAPFGTLEDFLTRVDPRQSEALSLASVGALHGFGAIPSMLKRLEGGDWQRGQLSLFEWSTPAPEADWSLEQRVAAQEDLLGIGVDAHPLELVAGQIAAAGALGISEAVAQPGRRVTVAGVRQSSHPSRTRRGLMLYLSLEDLGGMLEVSVPPELYRRARSALGSSAPLLITGVVEMDAARGEPFLRAERVEQVR